MPITKQKPIHKNAAKSVKQTLQDVIKYITDSDKCTIHTADGKFRLIDTDEDFTEHAQFEHTTATEWDTLKKEYAETTGRTQGDSDVLAYHVIQSFDPSEEIDPETALKIGKELAKRLTGGNHNFVIATHVDKEHIHNHIIFNSTAIDATHKYKDIIRSHQRHLQHLNDEISAKYSYNPPEKSEVEEKRDTSYLNWLKTNTDTPTTQTEKPTWQNILRQIIDMILRRDSQYKSLQSEEEERINKIISERLGDNPPQDLEEFLQILRDIGYKIKADGKYISVKADGQERYTRLKDKTLGVQYTRESIENFLAQHQNNAQKSQYLQKIQTTKLAHKKAHLRKLIDTTKYQNSVGLERWATIQNIKTLAETHSYMLENNLQFSDITDKLTRHETTLADLQNQQEILSAYTDRQAEINEVRSHIINMTKFRKIFAGYKNGGYNPNYKAEHAAELSQYDQARKFFDEYLHKHNLQKMPTMKELKVEYDSLKADKNDYYASLKMLKTDIKNLRLLKENAMDLLDLDENGNSTKTAKQREQERKNLLKISRENKIKSAKYKRKRR